MVESQFVIAPPAETRRFSRTMAPGGEPAVRDLLQDVAGLRRSVSFRAPDAGLSCVVGIGSAAWDRLFAGPRPRDLHPFVALTGSRHRAPSTPGDLLFHLASPPHGPLFRTGPVDWRTPLRAVAALDEVHGFKYFDERDLLGFVDGSENPEGRVAADAVFIGDEDPDFGGGSYVIVQKYVHDLAAGTRCPTQEQEGHRPHKAGERRRPGPHQARGLHVALNTITDADGNERRSANTPFGSIGQREFGTYFIGDARLPR